MKDYDEAIEHYRLLNPKPMRFTYLVRLDMRLYQPPADNENELLIDLWLGQPDQILDPQRLRITLYGAQPPKPRTLFPGMKLYLEIMSIRDRQLSNLYYRLMDLEGLSEIFYCRHFETKLDHFYLDSLV